MDLACVGSQSFGDASKTVSINSSGIDTRVIAARLGAELVALMVGGQDAPLSVAEQMMTAQLDCLESVGRTGPVRS